MNEPQVVFDTALAQLIELAARQGAQTARLEAQEARLARLEETAARRVGELSAENRDLRESLVLANGVLGEIKATCERHGWSVAAGPTALEWLEHVLSVAATGWPSVN